MRPQVLTLTRSGLLALAVMTAAPAQAASTASWVFSTVQHSEWCPDGNLRVDMASGRYALTPRAARDVCQAPGLERPTVEDRLSRQALQDLAAAHARALSEGLETPACQGGEPPELIIDNGGPRVLLVVHGGTVLTAPERLGCWSTAAHALHTLLDKTFPWKAYP